MTAVQIIAVAMLAIFGVWAVIHLGWPKTKRSSEQSYAPWSDGGHDGLGHG